MRDEILNHHSPQNFCIMPQNRGQIEASCLELPLFGLRLRQSRSSAFETSSIKSFLTTYQYLNQYPTPSSPFHTKTNKQTTHTHKNETEQTNENKTKLNIKNYGEIFLYSLNIKFSKSTKNSIFLNNCHYIYICRNFYNTDVGKIDVSYKSLD